MELVDPKIKKRLTFQEETCKAWKTKMSYVSLENFSPHFWMTGDEAVKLRKTLIF